MVSATILDDIEHATIGKRRPHRTNTKEDDIGQCDITAYFPQYPKGNDVFMYEKDITKVGNSDLNQIHRWYYWKRDPNCALQIVGPVPYNRFFGNGSPPENDEDKQPSIDHVFEKSFLREYWWEITNKSNRHIHGSTPSEIQKNITCKDLIYYGSDASGLALIDNVYNMYPRAKQNKNNRARPIDPQYLNDLIGMDAWTNYAKGLSTTPHYIRTLVTEAMDVQLDQSSTLKEVYDAIEFEIDLLEKLFIGVEMIKKKPALEAMVRQNQRIFARLQDIDNYAWNCKNDPAVKANMWSFATRYQEFMEDRFTGTKAHSINQAISNAFTALVPRIFTDISTAIHVGKNTKWPTKLAQKNALEKLAEFKRRYALMKQFETNPPSVTISWEWNYVSKRDSEGTDGGSCPVQSNSEIDSTSLKSITQSQTDSSTAPFTTANQPSASNDGSFTTMLSAEPTVTKVPFELRNLQCNNADDFRGHGDISERSVEYVARYFCDQAYHREEFIRKGSEAISYISPDRDLHFHEASFTWVDGCVTEKDEIIIVDPWAVYANAEGVTRMSCPELLHYAWKNCINRGVGGSVDVGCVRYAIKSGLQIDLRCWVSCTTFSH
ncbi:hypothetical protein EDB81DRAFT_880390 [Dactylonectria macrodidyma]|uniref:Uncharacterized protein n=1 Tax=Dactylonectria macrodidyma TaxID=307937 RepID=A0A9P9FA33_9HYPO|nr:hypothetical protein EDB81DRAFT_880390 [Dactylonectria macrodidyma]